MIVYFDICGDICGYRLYGFVFDFAYVCRLFTVACVLVQLCVFVVVCQIWFAGWFYVFLLLCFVLVLLFDCLLCMFYFVSLGYYFVLYLFDCLLIAARFYGWVFVCFFVWMFMF